MTDLRSFEQQHQRIRDAFAMQAPVWRHDDLPAEVLGALEMLPVDRSSVVLDVAAGTGALARTVAPRVKRLVALDLTPEMLELGRDLARHSGLTNIDFELGPAESLPYPSSSFHAVVTRFSLHHLQNPSRALLEMRRVCRTNGALLIIDLVAPEDAGLASRYNHFERLRDPSHVRALSEGELERALRDAGFRPAVRNRWDRAVDLEGWLNVTRCDGQPRDMIIEAVKEELDGRGTTGLRPFVRSGRLSFTHAMIAIQMEAE